MALDHSIREREPKLDGSHHHHAGRASETRGLNASSNQIQEYLIFEARTQRILAHEGGHSHIGNVALGGVVGDQWTPGDWEAVQEVRAEIKAMCE